MLSYFDLRKGVKFILDGQPYEVLEFQQIGKAQDVVVARTKIRNLTTGKVFERSFHQDDTFEEAEISKTEVKFLYNHREKYIFCYLDNPSKRFELKAEELGEQRKFLKPNQIVEAIIFKDEVINVSLPIKVHLKVVEAPPALRTGRAEAGTKQITLETGTKIAAPVFIKEGNIIEVNTETGEYVRRVE